MNVLVSGINLLIFSHSVGASLRPIVSLMNGPSLSASHFLEQLLWPLVDHAAKETTFVSGIGLVRRLE